MANLKDVIYLSAEDYQTLVSTGTVTIGSETLTYNENNLYLTPETQNVKSVNNTTPDDSGNVTIAIPTIVGTSSGDNWTDININGTEKSIPQGTVTQVTAGAGLNTTSDNTSTDGGNITDYGTLYLSTTGVNAGTYQGITVDKYGRVTSASNMGYTTNAGTVIGSNLTTDKIIVGNSGVNIKASNYSIDDLKAIAEGKTASYIIQSKTDISGTETSDEQFTDVSAITGVTIANLKLGDTILVKDLDVPDYWVSQLNTSGNPAVVTSVSLNKMETTKVDVPDEDTVAGWGFTKNIGTVTSVRVQADTGLSSSEPNAQTQTLNTTISVANTHKLPTTAEWNHKLDKVANDLEWNQSLANGSNGKVCIGKFFMYDSNVTIELSLTTSTTFSATLVIATQNINRTGSAGTIKANVYGDDSNSITPLLTIFRPNPNTANGSVEVYANLPGWSKCLVHARAVALESKTEGSQTTATYAYDILTSVSSIPTEITGKSLVTPVNLLTTNFQAKFGNQDANKVYAGPASGSAAAPSFRALVAADIPAHASSATTYGIGTTANYGHVKFQNGDLNGVSSSDGIVAGLAHTHSQYLTAEADTLATVTARGAETSNVVTFKATPVIEMGSTSSDTAASLTLQGTSGGQDAASVTLVKEKKDSGTFALTVPAKNGTLATLEDIENLPEPMVFKGAATITKSGNTYTIAVTVPSSASDIKEGYTYKITSAPSGDTNFKSGDTIIAAQNNPGSNPQTNWTLIPSGDEPVGTVTEVATGVGLTTADGNSITSSGTVKAKLKDETLNASDSTKSTSSSGGLYAIEADKSGNLAVRVPWTDTDNNQTVKAGNVTFDVNDIVNFEGSGIVTVTGDATHDKITIGASVDTAISTTSTNAVQNKVIPLYIASRGENLLTNGTALLQNNYNFSALTYDGSDTYYAGGCFKHTGGRIEPKTDEYMPVDVSQTYEISYYAKSSSATSTLYDYLAMYDIDKLEVSARFIMWMSGSTTTLAQELKNGDTKVYLTSVAGFNKTTSNSYQKGLIFWNYTNSFGYTFGTETYSRNVYTNLWAGESSFDTTNNYITLSSAWNKGTIPAGTAVSQSNDGSSYTYMTTGAAGSTNWFNRKATMSGVGKNNASGKFREGTAFVRLGWLIDQNSEANVTWKLSTLSVAKCIPMAVVDDILDGTTVNLGTNNTSNPPAFKYAPYAAATATSTWVANNSNAGKLYLGTNNPSKTTRLNYNGYLYATKLYSGGNEVLTSYTETDTLASVTGRGATTSTAVTMSGGLDVTGNNLKLNKISAPTTSGGSTYGNGSDGQVLKANSSGQIYWANDNNDDHYPTTFAWTNGTTSGPTGSLTGNTGFSAVTFNAIPSASDSQSGIVTTDTQTFAGAKTFATSVSSPKYNITSSGTVKAYIEYDATNDAIKFKFS